MSLSKKVKVGLDETRILILGVQILLGFGLQLAFQNLSPREAALKVAAVALVVTAVGLIIAPSAQHRIVEGGDDSERLRRVIRRFAGYALAPFAAALAVDVFLSRRGRAVRSPATWRAR